MAAQVQLNVVVNESAAIASLNNIWAKAQELSKTKIVLDVDSTKIDSIISSIDKLAEISKKPIKLSIDTEAISDATKSLDSSTKKAKDSVEKTSASVLSSSENFKLAKESFKETSAGVKELTETWKKGNETIINSVRETKKGVTETTKQVKDYEQSWKEAAKEQEALDKKFEASSKSAKKRATELANAYKQKTYEEQSAFSSLTKEGFEAYSKDGLAGLEKYRESLKQTSKESEEFKKQAEKDLEATRLAAEKEMERASNSVSAFFDKLASAATLLAIRTLTKNIREALNEMKAVDTELVTIQKATGATKEEMQRYSSDAYAVAAELGTTASEYLSSVAEFAKAGYKDLSKEMGELAVMTASVGNMTQAEATSMLLAVDAAYKYKGSIKELTAVVDGMNEIGNNFATDVDKIAEGLGKVSSIASLAGVGVDELSAALGTITAVTQRSGTEAATALRALFLNIIGDTKTEIEDGATWTAGEIAGLRDVLKEFVPEIVAEADKLGTIINPMEAIGALAEAYKKGVLDEQKLIEMVDDIGGKLRSSQLLTLIQNWDMYENMLGTFAGAEGSAAKEYGIYLDSWEAKTKQLSATWTEFVQKTISSDFAKGIIDTVKELITGFGDLGTMIEIVGIALVGINFNKIATGISTVVTAIKGGISATTLVGAAITALAAIITYTTISHNKYVESINKSADASIDKSTAANDEVSALTELYAQYITAEKGSEQFITASSKLKAALESELGEVEDLTNGYKELINQKNSYSRGKAYESKYYAGLALEEAYKDSVKKAGGGWLAGSSSDDAGDTTRFYDWTGNDNLPKELQESIWAELQKGAKRKTVNSGQVDEISFIIPIKYDVEGYSDFIESVSQAYDVMSQYAADNDAEWIYNTSTYKELKKVYEGTTEAAEKYASAVQLINEQSANEAFSNDLQNGLITSQETFDKYIESIKNSNGMTDEYKEILLQLARDAFPEFANAAVAAAEAAERPFKEARDRAEELLNIIREIAAGSEEPVEKVKTIGESLSSIKEAKGKSDTALEEGYADASTTALEEATSELNNIDERIVQAKEARAAIRKELILALRESKYSSDSDIDIEQLRKDDAIAQEIVDGLEEKRVEAQDLVRDIEGNDAVLEYRLGQQEYVERNAEVVTAAKERISDALKTATEAKKQIDEASAEINSAFSNADKAAADSAFLTAQNAKKNAVNALSDAEIYLRNAQVAYDNAAKKLAEAKTPAAKAAYEEAGIALEEAKYQWQSLKTIVDESEQDVADLEKLVAEVATIESIRGARKSSAQSRAEKVQEELGTVDEAIEKAESAYEKVDEALEKVKEAREELDAEAAKEAADAAKTALNEATDGLDEAQKNLDALKEPLYALSVLADLAGEGSEEASLYAEAMTAWAEAYEKLEKAKKKYAEAETTSNEIEGISTETDTKSHQLSILKTYGELADAFLEKSNKAYEIATEASKTAEEAIAKGVEAASEASFDSAQQAYTEAQLAKDKLEEAIEDIKDNVWQLKNEKTKAYEYAVKVGTKEAWDEYYSVEKAYNDALVLQSRAERTLKKTKEDVEAAGKLVLLAQKREDALTDAKRRRDNVEKYAEEAEDAATRAEEAKSKAESARDAAKSAKESEDVDAAKTAAEEAKTALVEAQEAAQTAQEKYESLNKTISQMETEAEADGIKDLTDYSEEYVDALSEREEAEKAVTESADSLAEATTAAAEATQLAIETATNAAAKDLLGLVSELENAKKAIEDFKNAGSNEHGGVFGDFASMFETALELSGKGLFGSNELSAALIGIFGSDIMESIGFDSKTASGWLQNNDFIKAAFENGGQDYGIGAANYLKTLIDTNSAMKDYIEYTENADGSLNFNVKDAEGLAEQLGVSEGLINAMVDAWSIFDSSLVYSEDSVKKLVEQFKQLGFVIGDNENVDIGAVAKYLFGNGFSVKDIYDIQNALKEMGYTLTDENGNVLENGITNLTEFLEGLSEEDGTEIKITVNDDGTAEAVKTAIVGVQDAVDGLNSNGTATVTVNGAGSASNAESKILSVGTALDLIDGKSATVHVKVDKDGSLPSVETNAKGTDSSRGGLALVNDEKGGFNPELIVDGNRAYIAGGGYPTIVNLSKGATVYTATETRKILGGSNYDGVSIPAYGFGKIEGVPTDPSKLIDKEETKDNGGGGGKGSGKSSSGSGSSSKDTDLLDMVQKYMEDILEEAQNARDEQLKLIEEQLYYLKYGQELSEKSLELEEARMELLEAEQNLVDAQTQRTVRYFNQETGQWEWMADKKAINEAQQSLADAQKGLVNARYDALEEIWSKLEDEIQKAIEKEDTVSLDKLIELMKKSEAADSVDALLELIDDINEFIATTGEGINFDLLNSFDNGGIAIGKGFMPKATREDEVVLDGSLASNIIAPNTSGNFVAFTDALSTMFGIANEKAQSLYNGNGITNNSNGNYYINGVQIGSDMVDRPLSEILSVLPIYAGR